MAKVLKKLDPPKGWTRLAFTPDGKRLLTVRSTDDIDSWDLATGKRSKWLRQNPALGRIKGMLFSPCGRRLAVISDKKGGRVVILDARTAKPAGETDFRPNSDRAVVFARKGEWLVVGCGSVAFVYDACTGKRLFACRGNGWGSNSIATMSVSPCHRWLVTCGLYDDSVKVWDLTKW